MNSDEPPPSPNPAWCPQREGEILMSNPGPCVRCGATNYSLSFGGPSICPACDCGTPPEVTRLRTDLERVTRERNSSELSIASIADLVNIFAREVGSKEVPEPCGVGIKEAVEGVVYKLRATIARLTADLAEARKDGERLDWLYEQVVEVWRPERIGRRLHLFTAGLASPDGSVDLREAIDAARDAGKGAKR